MTVTATEFKQSGGNSRELVPEMKARKKEGYLYR